jgi:hypothetical protein
MNKYLLVFSLLFFAKNGTAQLGYKIDVNAKEFANKYIYLGYHYGKQKPIKDSLKLNALGKGTFKGTKKLPGGIYLLGYPDKRQYVEFLLDKNQVMGITLTNATTAPLVTIANNPDASVFQNYQNYMGKIGVQYEAAKKLPSTTPTEVAIAESAFKKINDDVNTFRERLKKQYPKHFLTAIFKVMEEPKVPEAAQHPGGVYDSTYAWYSYKSNYWKGISMADARLLRTPVFENKFDNYFENVIYPKADSVKMEVNTIIKQSEADPEMFKYITTKLIERYINPKIMGLDAVYLDIFERYISPGKTAGWFDDKQKKYLFDRYYSLLGNIIGEPASPINLIDTFKKPIDIYKIDADYLVLCFWDATCGHCKEVVPKLDSMNKAAWYGKGVQLLGIMTDGGYEAWTKYIVENNFTTWMHAYEPDGARKADAEAGRANFRQLYDIVSTPKIFVLSKDKRIIAKGITYDQAYEIIENDKKRKVK